LAAGQAQWSLLRYVHTVRPALIEAKRCDALFVGYGGKDGIGVDALAYRLKMLCSG